MGQPVNPLLGNTQALLGADPELYRQQLVQAEQSRIQALPPQQALAAQLGTLFGRGLGNVAQGQNFFEVTNPVLQNLTKIQNVYNAAMQASDPTDPLSFYKELQTRFAEAGLGQQAMMATQELRRAQSEAEKFKGEKLKTQALETEVYTKNPTLLDEQIAKARSAGNDQLANRLAEQRGQIQLNIDRTRQKEDLDMAVRRSNIAVNQAQIEKLKKDVDTGKITVQTVPDGFGGATVIVLDRDGKLVQEYKVGGLPQGGAPAAPAAKPATSGGRQMNTQGFQILEVK
jgi:hypothetical protein